MLYKFILGTSSICVWFIMNAKSAINKEIFAPHDERMLGAVQVKRRTKKKIPFLATGGQGEYLTYICLSGMLNHFEIQLSFQFVCKSWLMLSVDKNNVASWILIRQLDEKSEHKLSVFLYLNHKGNVWTELCQYRIESVIQYTFIDFQMFLNICP